MSHVSAYMYMYVLLQIEQRDMSDYSEGLLILLESYAEEEDEAAE